MNKYSTELTLGARIKFYRLRMEISQETLALEADVGLATVSQIENDLRKPSVETVYKIAKALRLNALETASLFYINLYRPENI